MLYQKIGRRIYEKRVRLHLTQGQLAEQAGISLSFLGHIERGTRKLSVDTLYRLAIALNCSADDLLDTASSGLRGLTVRDLLCLAMEKLDENEKTAPVDQ